MSSDSVEDRINRLEQKVRQLEQRTHSDEDVVPWWDRVAGAFKDNPIYSAAMKLGTEMRTADQMQDSSE
jgi:hypothetical protein